MRFSNFEMEFSTALREVCMAANLCSISLRARPSVVISRVLDTASNSSWSLVLLLQHFLREDDDSFCFLSFCFLFSQRTWLTTSSNWRPQAVPGARKWVNRQPRLCRAHTRDPEAAGSRLSHIQPM